MLINDKRLNRHVLFKDINIGSLFYCDGCHYIRVMSTQIPNNQDKLNAVDLETGKLAHIGLNENVLELEGEVWVK